MMRCAVLIFMLHVAYGDDNVTEYPPWVNKNLSQYQDAWKTLNQSNSTRYSLVLSTYSSNPLWGTNFTCVTVETVNVYANKTVESLFRFKNSSSGSDMYNVTETVGVTKTYNYTTENAVQYTLPNGTTLNDTLIFSDYNTCDVLSIPYENGGYGCELWVNSKNLSDIPLCCMYIYDVFCASYGRYEVYGKEKCNNGVQSSPAESSSS